MRDVSWVPSVLLVAWLGRIDSSGISDIVESINGTFDDIVAWKKNNNPEKVISSKWMQINAVVVSV